MTKPPLDDNVAHVLISEHSAIYIIALARHTTHANSSWRRRTQARGLRLELLQLGVCFKAACKGARARLRDQFHCSVRAWYIMHPASSLSRSHNTQAHGRLRVLKCHVLFLCRTRQRCCCRVYFLLVRFLYHAPISHEYRSLKKFSSTTM